MLTTTLSFTLGVMSYFLTRDNNVSGVENDFSRLDFLRVAKIILIACNDFSDN